MESRTDRPVGRSVMLVITVRAMPWFRRVWTLQEAIIPESLRFVGFEGNNLQTNVTTVNELQNFTKTFDEISDVTSAFHDRSKFASNPWLASSIHPCTATTIDPFSVAKDVSDVVNSIKPTNLQWYKEMSGQDAVITLRYTVETVFRQLGSNNRECTNLNDLIYGVSAVLELEIEVDYKRRFEDVFFEALKQLVKRGLCVLPKRPQIGHGETWLPSLEHIDQRDAWRTVKSRDMYHNLVCKGTGIFAHGRLIQMHHPNVFRTSLGGLASMLEDIVLSMHREDEFHLDSIDPSLLAITSVALWMFRNHGSDHNVTTSGVESLICSVCNDAHSQIIEEIRLSAPVVVRVMGHNEYSITQMVRDMLECCSLVSVITSIYANVPLNDRNAILVCKKTLGLVLYSAPTTVQIYNAYGMFYKNIKRSKVRQVDCNILAQHSNGIWDNHGEALCWYISRSWAIRKQKVLVGTIH